MGPRVSPRRPLLAETGGRPISTCIPLDLAQDSTKERVMHELGDKSHWHEPTGINRAGVGKFTRPKTPYDLFMNS